MFPPVPKATWRVGGGNIYVGNRFKRNAVRVATDTLSHSWGWSEAGTSQRQNQRARGYHALTSFGFPDRRDADDCSMLVRKELALRHFSMTQVCDDRPQQAKIAHSRVFSMVAYEMPFLGAGLIGCHVAIHPNWVQGLDSANAPAAAEFIKSMAHLNAMLRFATQMGWLKTVSGDFNVTENAQKNFTTPYDVFRKFGMDWRTERLDGIAWDGMLRLARWHTIDKSITGSDHDKWTVADLRLKGRG